MNSSSHSILTSKAPHTPSKEILSSKTRLIKSFVFFIDDFLSRVEYELSTTFQTAMILLMIVNMTVFLEERR